MGHGRSLINVEEQNKQLEIYEKIISKGLSVRNTEKLVQKLKSGVKNGKKKYKTTTIYDDTKNALEKYFNSNVSIKANEKGKGSILIPFSSNVHLKELIKKIKGED